MGKIISAKSVALPMHKGFLALNSETKLRAHWTAPTLSRLLGRIDGFGRVPSEQSLQELINGGRFLTFDKGERITSREDATPTFLVVLKGRVRLYSVTPGGREFLLAFLEPGHIFGLRPCLDHSTRSYDSVAERETTLLTVPGPKLRTLLAGNAELMTVAVQFLCHRLGVVSQALEQFAVWGPTQQLGWRILDLMRAPYPGTASNSEIRLSVSQDDLAAMIGKSRQTTNKLLKDLNAAGFISIDYGGLVVRDLAGLKSFVYPQGHY